MHYNVISLAKNQFTFRIVKHLGRCIQVLRWDIVSEVRVSVTLQLDKLVRRAAIP